MFVPYSYEGTWLIRKDFAKSPYALPLPYHERMWETPQWKSCGDSQPDHQTQSFLWYFWLPSRYGCDQKLDVDYQMVDISLSDETEQTISTFPEYARMIRVKNGKKIMKMTYAFGNVS